MRRIAFVGVLVVEDDAPLASFLRKGLEAEHYAVDVAADGDDARWMASECDYDLMILDLNLPKMDGISVLRAVRPEKPSLPILVLTGRSRIEDRVQCLVRRQRLCHQAVLLYRAFSARAGPAAASALHL